MKPSYLDFMWSVIELNTSSPYGVKNIYCFNTAGYRENISFSWFFHGLKRRNENRQRNLWYIDKFIGAYERVKGLKCHETEVYLPILESGDFIVCENLYDFYEKIGWDRKKQKYLTKENIIVK